MDREPGVRGDHTPPRGQKRRTTSTEPPGSKRGVNSRIPKPGDSCHWSGETCRNRVQEQCFVSGTFESSETGSLNIQGYHWCDSHLRTLLAYGLENPASLRVGARSESEIRAFLKRIQERERDAQQKIKSQTRIQAVSYTHLTLPTKA